MTVQGCGSGFYSVFAGMGSRVIGFRGEGLGFGV